MQGYDIKKGEHVFIAGMTGCGKTVLAEAYLAGYEYVIKLDTKGEVYERREKNEPLWRGLKEGRDFVVVEHLADIPEQTIKKIIYVPTFEEQSSEYYDILFKFIYDRGNTVLWIDELMQIADSPQKYPIYLKAIYTRGRSKGVSCWALTQRPMEIPTICIANSTHYFVFDLMLPQDRDKMVNVTGMYLLRENPSKYIFWYYKIGNRSVTKGTLKL